MNFEILNRNKDYKFTINKQLGIIPSCGDIRSYEYEDCQTIIAELNILYQHQMFNCKFNADPIKLSYFIGNSNIKKEIFFLDFIHYLIVFDYSKGYFIIHFNLNGNVSSKFIIFNDYFKFKEFCKNGIINAYIDQSKN